MSHKPKNDEAGADRLQKNLILIARAFKTKGASEADLAHILGPFFGLEPNKDQTDDEILNTTMKTWNSLQSDKTPDPIRFKISELIQGGMPLWDVEAYVKETTTDKDAASDLTSFANKLYNEQTAYFKAVEDRDRTSIYHKLGIPQDIAQDPMRDWNEKELEELFPKTYDKVKTFEKAHPAGAIMNTKELQSLDTAEWREARNARDGKTVKDSGAVLAKRNLDASVLADSKIGAGSGIAGAIKGMLPFGLGNVGQHVSDNTKALRAIYELYVPRKEVGPGADNAAWDAQLQKAVLTGSAMPSQTNDKSPAEKVGGMTNEEFATRGRAYHRATERATKSDTSGRDLRNTVNEKSKGIMHEAGLNPLTLQMIKLAKLGTLIDPPKD